MYNKLDVYSYIRIWVVGEFRWFCLQHKKKVIIQKALQPIFVKNFFLYSIFNYIFFVGFYLYIFFLYT